MSADLEALKQEIVDAKARYAEAVALARQTCEHPTLLEAPYEPSASGLFGPLLPLRICEDCGLEEEAWSFRVLTGRAYQVRRHEVYAARKGERALVGRGGVAS